MSLEKLKPIPYLDYLNKSNAGIGDQDLVNRGLTMLKRFNIHDDIDSKSAPLIFLLDLSTSRYQLMGKSCEHMLGYPVHYFMDGGLDFFLGKHKEEEFKLYNKKMFPEMIGFLKKYPKEKHDTLIFSRNHQVKVKDGTHLNILQKSSFIYDDQGIPVAIIGIGIDITHYKTDNSLIHTIEAISADNEGFSNQLLYKKVYFPNEEDAALSVKELEVLKWISDGLSSKQIAAKMKLSINTVNNHRKNMLMKSNCRNIFELLTQAVRSGII